MTRYHFPKNRSGWSPLMTTKELAEEFGITWQQLSGFMSNYQSPKPVCETRGKKYFNPMDMRNWWSAINSKAEGGMK